MQAANAVDRILREQADDIIDMERAVNSVKRKVQREPAAKEDDSKRKAKKHGRVGPKKGAKKGAKASKQTKKSAKGKGIAKGRKAK